MRLIALTLGILVAVLTVVTPAHAASPCKQGKYWLIDTSTDIQVEQLDVAGLPRKTSGYAPRCLVAEALAGLVQYRYENNGRIPRKLRVQGARWSAGLWIVRSERLLDTKSAPYESVTARHGRGRVTFLLYDITADPEYPDPQWNGTVPVTDVLKDCSSDPAQVPPGATITSTYGSEICWSVTAIVTYDITTDAADEYDAKLIALGVDQGGYEIPPDVLALLQQADRLNVAPRYAIIRYPGGELRQAWSKCC